MRRMIDGAYSGESKTMFRRVGFALFIRSLMIYVW